MLLLLMYPLRKRFRWLGVLGTIKGWFQLHMVLGVLGPVLVLFHSNFELGATNSNVALSCMLVVSGSGLFGRYFYSHIHHGLYGRKATLAELKDYAERLRWVNTNVQFLPELIGRLEAEEQRITVTSELTPLLARPFVGMFSVLAARRRLRRHVGQSLQTTPSAGAGSGRRHKL